MAEKAEVDKMEAMRKELARKERDAAHKRSELAKQWDEERRQNELIAMAREDAHIRDVLSVRREQLYMAHEDILSTMREKQDALDETYKQDRMKLLEEVYQPFVPFDFKQKRVRLPVLHSVLTYGAGTPEDMNPNSSFCDPGSADLYGMDSFDATAASTRSGGVGSGGAMSGSVDMYFEHFAHHGKPTYWVDDDDDIVSASKQGGLRMGRVKNGIKSWVDDTEDTLNISNSSLADNGLVHSKLHPLYQQQDMETDVDQMSMASDAHMEALDYFGRDSSPRSYPAPTTATATRPTHSEKLNSSKKSRAGKIWRLGDADAKDLADSAEWGKSLNPDKAKVIANHGAIREPTIVPKIVKLKPIDGGKQRKPLQSAHFQRYPDYVESLLRSGLPAGLTPSVASSSSNAPNHIATMRSSLTRVNSAPEASSSAGRDGAGGGGGLIATQKINGMSLTVDTTDTAAAAAAAKGNKKSLVTSSSATRLETNEEKAAANAVTSRPMVTSASLPTLQFLASTASPRPLSPANPSPVRTTQLLKKSKATIRNMAQIDRLLLLKESKTIALASYSSIVKHKKISALTMVDSESDAELLDKSRPSSPADAVADTVGSGRNALKKSVRDRKRPVIPVVNGELRTDLIPIARAAGVHALTIQDKRAAMKEYVTSKAVLEDEYFLAACSAKINEETYLDSQPLIQKFRQDIFALKAAEFKSSCDKPVMQEIDLVAIQAAMENRFSVRKFAAKGSEKYPSVETGAINAGGGEQGQSLLSTAAGEGGGGVSSAGSGLEEAAVGELSLSAAIDAPPPVELRQEVDEGRRDVEREGGAEQGADEGIEGGQGVGEPNRFTLNDTLSDTVSMHLELERSTSFSASATASIAVGVGAVNRRSSSEKKGKTSTIPRGVIPSSPDKSGSIFLGDSGTVEFPPPKLSNTAHNSAAGGTVSPSSTQGRRNLTAKDRTGTMNSSAGVGAGGKAGAGVASEPLHYMHRGRDVRQNPVRGPYAAPAKLGLMGKPIDIKKMDKDEILASRRFAGSILKNQKEVDDFNLSVPDLPPGTMTTTLDMDMGRGVGMDVNIGLPGGISDVVPGGDEVSGITAPEAIAATEATSVLSLMSQQSVTHSASQESHVSKSQMAREAKLLRKGMGQRTLQPATVSIMKEPPRRTSASTISTGGGGGEGGGEAVEMNQLTRRMSNSSLNTQSLLELGQSVQVNQTTIDVDIASTMSSPSVATKNSVALSDDVSADGLGMGVVGGKEGKKRRQKAAQEPRVPSTGAGVEPTQG